MTDRPKRRPSEAAGPTSDAPEEARPQLGGSPEPEVAAGGAAATAAPGAESPEVGSLRRELAERTDQYLRLAADFENFRRRKTQEVADRSRYASEDAARALLPVLDNLRRAVGHLGEGDGQPLQDGLRMVIDQFEAALRDIGVVAVETVGARFDPSVHEAIGGEESDQVSEDTVVAELQPGFRLHDRLLRPALVRVAHPRHRGEDAG